MPKPEINTVLLLILLMYELLMYEAERPDHALRRGTLVASGHSRLKVVAGIRAPLASREIGGPCRDRTYDQLIKSQLLYQLS